MPKRLGEPVRAFGLREKGFKEAHPGIWRAYLSWRGMRDRVYGHNPLHHRYREKNITICNSWDFFWNFFKDMGERPEGLELDRKNNAGNYEPGNCKWATAKENCSNRDNNKWITYKGITKTWEQWGHFIGGKGSEYLHRRITELGWSEERAVSTPVKKYRPRKK